MDDKSCENCYHFSRHYFFANKRFIYANCGRCLNPEIHKSTRKRKHTLEACDKWVLIEKREEPNKQILERIKEAAQDLDDILAFLNSDVFR